MPADDPLPERVRVTPRDVNARNLVLLEEGHCLRDQALAYCAQAQRDPTTGLGATSLATIMQMVASGYGVTLVPEVAVDVEVRDDRVKLLRFAEPQPRRSRPRPTFGWPTPKSRRRLTASWTSARRDQGKSSVKGSPW